ncbi:hypothetical protein Scep_026048 [Stephania cephalantha]|uniref:RNase H type-1 domain-containing protein n=1 Tax=Stephania cephalantha TaxID=152367 RepID=A0AAP0EJT8_9MAGN
MWRVFGIREGVVFANELMIYNRVFESDSACVVELISNLHELGPLGQLINEIVQLGGSPHWDRFQFIYRVGNQVAHCLEKLAIDHNICDTWKKAMP